MASLGARLAKSFIHTSKCRKAGLIMASNGANHGLRWMSASTSSTTLLSAGPSTVESAGDALETPVKPKRGRKPKDPNAPPRKRVSKKATEATETTETTELDTTGNVIVNDEVVKRRRRRKGSTTEEGEDAKKVLRPKKPKQAAAETLDQYSSATELPPADAWHHYFPYQRDWVHRTAISNIQSARKAAEEFIPEGSKDKVVIEVNPGPGQLSRALIALPKERIKRLIIIEDAAAFQRHIKALEDLDPRVTVIQKPGKQWSTYDELESEGVLNDIIPTPWEQDHTQLHFIMQMPTDTHGEQFVSQLVRAVPDQQWLFKYGRIPMSFILTKRMWERVKAPPGTGTRCKVSAMSQSVGMLTEHLTPSTFVPHWEHFYPTRFGQPQNIEMTAGSIIPRADSFIPMGDLDVWDYCLRKLFVLRATPLSKCISGLGPGANNLLEKISDPNLPPNERVDIKKRPRDFNPQEWSIVVNAFKNWPFRPTDLGIEMVSDHSR